MTNLIRVLLVSRLTVSDFIGRANAVYSGLNLNPDYPNPPVPLSVFRKAIDDYLAAVTAAFDGSTQAKAQRNLLGETVRRMLRLLGHYVEVSCNDNLATFLSSGFQPAPNTRTRRQPLSESIRKIDPGHISGQVRVSLVPVPGAVSYELRWAQVAAGGTPGDWISHPVARVRTPSAVNSLTPGATYVFQARALTTSGFTDWSDSVTRICT